MNPSPTQSRDEFEAAMRVIFGYLSLQREGYAGNEPYVNETVSHAWLLWQSRDPEIDALKARIAELENHGEIQTRDTLVMRDQLTPVANYE